MSENLTIENRQYSDYMLDSMQSVYGEGFLSPGGAEETRTMLAGMDLAGCRVLDLGCGVGGTAILLACEYGVESVVALDVEPGTLERARSNIDARGLGRRVELRLTAPGPLPLDERSFDLVISKDVVCHIDDKNALFAETSRVLKPGGRCVTGDWHRGDVTVGTRYEQWTALLAGAGLEFWFEPGHAYRHAMEAAGFDSIEVRDNTAASIAGAELELQAGLQLSPGAGGTDMDEAGVARRIKLTRWRLESLRDGSLEHWHLYGRRAR